MPPGFFGKLPSRGDFVERRLDRAFCTAYDAWLQASMLASKASLGDAWLPAYLEAPLWRFAIEAGVCGPRATAGVIMASVDRVGRYYPLTIATHLDGPWPAAAFLALDSWFADLETQALAALDDDCTFEIFDSAMTAIPAPLPNRTSLFPDASSLWWTLTPEPRSIRTHGMPDAAAFLGMLTAPP